MALRYQFTFIDVCDGDRAAGACRRSASAPRLTGPPVEKSVQEEARQAYVDALPTQLALWPDKWVHKEAAAATIEAHDGMFGKKSMSSEEGETPTSVATTTSGSFDDMVKSPSLASDIGTRSSVFGFGIDMVSSPSVALEMSPLVWSPPASPASAAGPAASLAGGEQDVIDVGSGVFPSGSVVHPHLCARPCAFFLKGACMAGTSCRFCHESHETHAHLDKRHRAALRKLEPEKAHALILPELLAAVRAIDSSPATLCKFQRFVEAVGATMIAGELVVPKLQRPERVLSLGYKGKNARFLLNASLKVFGERSPHAEAVARELYMHLSGAALR